MSTHEKMLENHQSPSQSNNKQGLQSLLDEFRISHPLQYIDFKGNKIEYYSSGKGDVTVLLLPGGAGIAEINYRRILHLEENFRVLAPSFMYTKTIEEYYQFTNLLLKQEKVGTLILLGGSGGGMLAQGLFHRMHQKIAAMLLSNTYPPVPKWVRSYRRILYLLRIIPSGLAKKLMLKMMGKILKPEELSTMTASQQLEVSQMQDQMEEIIATKYSKKVTLLPQYNLITYWNAEIYRPEMYEGWQGKILVMVGDTDKGYEQHGLMMAQFPNMNDHIIKDAGHMASITKREEYKLTIDDFLAEFI